uniref:Uncharacterized protein n=1 Tax=Nelumbo nucifera TaxID=4432 RepID=A0A822XNH6_NELNU|nr:TPA_asm: hypothetical protein HUJ06_023055 [Nelumbo nucifera]
MQTSMEVVSSESPRGCWKISLSHGSHWYGATMNSPWLQTFSRLKVETDSPSGRVRKHETTTMTPPLLVACGHLFSRRTPFSIESSDLACSARVDESEL